MADAWDYGPGNVDDYSFSSTLAAFTTAAAQSAAAINSVRASVASVTNPASTVTTNSRTDVAQTTSKTPAWVWLIGAVVIFKVLK